MSVKQPVVPMTSSKPPPINGLITPVIPLATCMSEIDETIWLSLTIPAAILYRAEKSKVKQRPLRKANAKKCQTSIRAEANNTSKAREPAPYKTCTASRMER